MAEFLTREGISENITRVILEAKGRLVIISPYINLSVSNFELLKKASKKGIRITIVFGKRRLNRTDRKYLKTVDKVDVRFLKNLHSKCYLNETSMVITSMNLVEYSQLNNREMGILISRQQDAKMFEDALLEISGIFKESRKVNLAATSPIEKTLTRGNYASSQLNFEKGLYKNVKDGHCIRCSAIIAYDPERPYCEFCYQSRLKTRGNQNENVCHSCGNHNNSTRNRPECFSCYSGDEWLHKNYT